MTADASASQSIPRDRSIAWIYYAVLTIAEMIDGFQTTAVFLVALACRTYLAYCASGRPSGGLPGRPFEWRSSPAGHLRPRRHRPDHRLQRRRPRRDCMNDLATSGDLGPLTSLTALAPSIGTCRRLDLSIPPP
jgi:hypothetical protein